MASATRMMPPVPTRTNLVPTSLARLQRHRRGSAAVPTSRPSRAHPLERADTLRLRRPHEAEVFEDVADLVLGEERGHRRREGDWSSGPTAPAVGIMMAMRPPGRNTLLAISASVAAGSGISCSTARETRRASTVSSRRGSCCASARRKPTLGPAWAFDRAGQHRLGDVDAEREPVRTRRARQLCGTLPCVGRCRERHPGGAMSSQSMGSRPHAGESACQRRGRCRTTSTRFPTPRPPDGPCVGAARRRWRRRRSRGRGSPC